MRRINLLLSMLVVGFLAISCGLLSTSNDDQATLDRLSEAGSDLTKSHPFDFYLYHPDQTGADALCAALAADGFQVSVQESAAGGDWLCLASLSMLPTIENLSELQNRFEELIKRFGGEYDGWETMVIP